MRIFAYSHFTEREYSLRIFAQVPRVRIPTLEFLHFINMVHNTPVPRPVTSRGAMSFAWKHFTDLKNGFAECQVKVAPDGRTPKPTGNKCSDKLGWNKHSPTSPLLSNLKEIHGPTKENSTKDEPRRVRACALLVRAPVSVCVCVHWRVVVGGEYSHIRIRTRIIADIRFACDLANIRATLPHR